MNLEEALIREMLVADIALAKEALDAGEWAMAAHHLGEAAEKAAQIGELAETEDEDETPIIDIPNDCEKD